jgi:prevent-host-death family protein
MVSKMVTERIEVPAGVFKARCLQLMDQVRVTRRPIVITKRGKPVAKLAPLEEEVLPLFGRLKGHSTARDDLIEPTGEVWDAADDLTSPRRR